MYVGGISGLLRGFCGLLGGSSRHLDGSNNSLGCFKWTLGG